MSVSDCPVAPAGTEDLMALLDRRARRTLKAILRFKDTHVDVHLPPDVAAELRSVILDEVNDLAASTKELMAVLAARAGEQVVVNQLWLERLEEIHRALVPPE